MIAKIISIGNSSGIVIPAQLLTSLHLKKDDRVVISEKPNGCEVQRAEKPRSFEAILEDFYGKPFDEALQEFSAEKDDVTIDWGSPVGEEAL